MQQQEHPSLKSQKGEYVIVRDNDNCDSDLVHKTAAGTTVSTISSSLDAMERNPRHRQSDYGGQSPKKLKAGDKSGSYDRSVAIPTVLTSMFSPDIDRSSNSEYNNSAYEEQHHHQPQHQYHEHYQPHRNSDEEYHEHHQPYRSVEENYDDPAGRRPIRSQSLTTPPRRHNSYPYYEGEEPLSADRAPPRRSRSDRNPGHHPYPPPYHHQQEQEQQHAPHGFSSGGPISPSSAFEAYPQQKQQQHHSDWEQQRDYEISSPHRRRGGLSPPLPPRHRDDPPQLKNPPISYICESARSCFPSTALGKRVRDRVRTMMEGTRLVPAARAVHYHREGTSKPRARSMQQQQQQQLLPEQSSNVSELEGHRPQPPHRSHNPHLRGKTIRLLDSTIEILETQSVLGRGTFSRITAVTIKEPNRKKREHQPSHEMEGDHPPFPPNSSSSSSNFHSHPPSRGRRPRYYACKSIKEELLVSNVARMGKRTRNRTSEAHLQSVEYCVIAASQLAYEAHVLSCLDHPNIVTMRGLDADGILGFEKRDHWGFFWLMDVLSGTLDQKIEKWRSEKSLGSSQQQHHRHQQQYYHRNHRHRHPRNNHGFRHPQAMQLLRHKEKIGICLQIASALEYLHERRIVYRDLKPSNVGFISDGPPHGDYSPHAAMLRQRVQLFDFGLSRELTPNQPALTGAIGTMRYMAPEVCLDASPYDCDCDIYSYAIVCWELWTQKIPFEDVGTPDLYREHVCQRGHRPVYRPEEEDAQAHHQRQEHRPIQAVPNEILALLAQAWKHDPKARVRWSKTQHQLALLDTLVGLQLEERELSESSAASPGPPGHAHHDEGFPSGNPSAFYHPRHSAMEDAQHRYAPNHAHPHGVRSHHNDWAEPIRIDHHNNDDSDSHFSLRDDDLNVDLGI